MLRFITRGKLKLNKLFGFISLILSFIGIFAFFMFNHAFLDEIRVIFDTFNLKSPDKIIAQLFLPFKTFFDISQFFSFIVFFINCVLAFFAVKLIIICIVTVSFLLHNKKEKNKIVPAHSAQFEAVYMINSRLNC